MRYKRKRMVVEATQYLPGMEHGFIEILTFEGVRTRPYITVVGGGKKILETGDYILNTETGRHFVMTADSFESQYELDE